MKAAIATKYGSVDDVVTLRSGDEGVPKPTVKPNSILVKVQACSLGPHDTRTLTGSLRAMIKPPKPFYTIGMDVCGVVEEVGPKTEGFSVGDVIIGTNGANPWGGLAEYMVVEAKHAVKKPERLSFIEGAAMASASLTGYLAVKSAKVKPGDRVLVLGGSGGVGTAVIQCAKAAGASFVATTSTNEALCKSLGADEVINYRERKWWEEPAFKDAMFDVIIDNVAKPADSARKSRAVLKPARRGGRFVAVNVKDEVNLKNMGDVMKMMLPAVGRMLSSKVRRGIPKYQMFLVAWSAPAFNELLALHESDKVRVVLDPESPFPFTEEGVKNALKKVAGGHAHGKVVVNIAA